MKVRSAIPAMLSLAACSHEPPPCPTVQTREVVVLMVSIMSQRDAPVTYQQEFATMDACESARRAAHSEMEQLVDRAKATDFNNQSPEYGWTDTRGYHSYAVHSGGGGGYPDMLATCSKQAVTFQLPQAAPQ